MYNSVMAQKAIASSFSWIESLNKGPQHNETLIGTDYFSPFLHLKGAIRLELFFSFQLWVITSINLVPNFSYFTNYHDIVFTTNMASSHSQLLCTMLLHITLKYFSFIFPLFSLFPFVTEKLEKPDNTQKKSFDQQTACEAPACQLIYTAVTC